MDEVKRAVREFVGHGVVAKNREIRQRELRQKAALQVGRRDVTFIATPAAEPALLLWVSGEPKEKSAQSVSPHLTRFGVGGSGSRRHAAIG
jgi:hypothetical protein